MRTRLVPAALALALTSLLPAIGRAASPAPTTLRFDMDRAVADGDDNWTLWFTIANHADGGVYGDSLLLDVESLDPGETGAPRTSRLDISLLLRAAPALSANDSARFEYAGLASAERAHLTLTFLSHTEDGRRFTASARLEAYPSEADERTPSRTLEVDGRKVETVFVPAAGAPASAPGVLLVHDDPGMARRLLAPAHALAGRGYAVMMVSLPGYGLSDGPRDFGGPASVRALGAALDALAKQPGVDAHRLGGWGLGRGAGPLAALAATRADLAAVALETGVYDLGAVHRGTSQPALAAAIEREAGRDSAAWRARSPLLEAARIRASVLIVHGEKDAVVPAAQAHAFAAALAAAGHPPALDFVSFAGHALPPLPAQRKIFEFLDRSLRGDPPPR